MIITLFTSIFFVLLAYWSVRRLLEKFQLSNISARPALITGCDSGFGYALTLKCVNAGMPVFAACLTQKGIDELKSETKKISQNAEKLLIAFQMDVTDETSVKKAKSFVEQEIINRDYKGLHGLVNNAGVVGNSAWDDWLRVDDYDTVWRVNSLGLIRVTHAFKPLVKKTKGRIVNTASVCGRVSLPGIGPYTVSKYAVEGYNDTLRLEMGQFGVLVCLLEPGFFRTSLTNSKVQSNMIEKVWKQADDSVRREYGENFFYFTKTMLQKSLNACSNKLELVVDAYFHALTSLWPRARYHVGMDSAFGFVPFSMLPTQIQDIVFWLIARLQGAPLPCAALAEKVQ